jgi:hypothetical protein
MHSQAFISIEGIAQSQDDFSVANVHRT